MSDDEADPELLELLRQHLGISSAPTDQVSCDTGILRDAEFVNHNAIDVLVDMYGTKAAAATIFQAMRDRQYSYATWQQHDLHPRADEGFASFELANFIFTMDLLNFSFWSELDESSRFQVEYRGKRWTGYTSLVACLRRALDEEVPVTTPRFWRSRHCSDEVLKHVFRSATDEQMPLLRERFEMMREAGAILDEQFGSDEDDGNDDDDDDDEFFEAHSHPYENGVSAGPTSAPEEANGNSSHANGEIEHAHAAGLGTVSASENGVDDTDLRPAPVHLSLENGRQESNGTIVDPVKRNDVHIEAAPLQSPDHSSAESLLKNIPAQLRRPDYSVVRLVQAAQGSAGRLVNLLAKHFPVFQDTSRFEGRKVRFLKRAQILAADLWAAFACVDLGEFNDIGHLTMFADYRVPQILHAIGVLSFSPPLEHWIRDQKPLETGHAWEVQLRGCSIWAVELIRREIVKQHPQAQVNTVLVDFFLYDLAKEREAQGVPTIPHHRTRSCCY